MNKKKTTSVKTILLIVVAVLLICAIATIFFMTLFSSKDDLTDLPVDQDVVLPDSGNQEKPDETEETSQVQVDLVDYVVYDLEQVDFRFVIAKVRVKANDATNIGLHHFKTNEGLVLDEVDQYVNELEKQSLFLGKQNVWFELVSSSTNYLARIFIPVKNDTTQELTLTSDLKDAHAMRFDLSNPVGTSEDLGYEADDIISDGLTYQMKVSNASIIYDDLTRVYEDGVSEPFLLPSSAEIHAFYVEAVSLWGDAIEIEEAWYHVDETNEDFEALNGQFKSNKYQNMLNSSVIDKESGYIFFVTLNPDEQPILYQGTLSLKLVGSNQPIQIQVDLK